MPRKKHWPSLRLKQDWVITIPAGTEFKQWPTGSANREHILSIHKDSTAFIRVDDDAHKFRPDLFEEVEG